MAAKGIAVATSLISIPLTVGYLGTERYGLWMVVSSVISMLGFADFGLGNGLLNAIAEANGKDDRAAARRYVSSAFFMLLAVSILILGLFAFCYSFIPWPRLFNVATELAGQETGPTMVVLVACFAASLPLGIVQRVQLGYQEGFASNLWQVVGSLLGLGGLLVAISLRADLPWLVLAMSGGPVLATLLNWLVQFGISRRWLLPSINAFGWNACRRLARTGILFFVLQVVVSFAYASDNIIIAQLLGVSSVTTYAIVQKLFSVGPMIQTQFVTPLWPAYGEAAARHDIDWARRAVWRSTIASIGVCIALAVPTLLLAQPILAMWVGSQVSPSFSLLLGFAIWTIFSGYGSAVSTFLNGFGKLGFQASIGVAFALCATALKLLLCTKYGDSGVIWATVIAFAAVTAIPTAIMVPRVLSSAKAGQ